MVRIRGVPFLWFPYNAPQEIGSARFDDTLAFEVSTSSVALTASRDNVVGEIAKTIFLALNWSAPVLGPDAIKQIIQKGREYNFWKK